MAQANCFKFDGNEYKIKRAEICGALADPYWCDTYNNGRGKALGWAITFDAQEQEVDDEAV